MKNKNQLKKMTKAAGIIIAGLAVTVIGSSAVSILGGKDGSDMNTHDGTQSLVTEVIATETEETICETESIAEVITGPDNSQEVLDTSGKPSNLSNPSTPNTPSRPIAPGASEKFDVAYHPADSDRDGMISEDESMRYITPEKQACIDAGYGVVVEMDGGEWYAVLTHGDGHVNGKSGSAILAEYLRERKLESTNMIGCWINSDNDWYWFTARDIRELLTEEDDEYWDF